MEKGLESKDLDKWPWAWSHLVWRGGEGSIWLDQPTRGPSPVRRGERRWACGCGRGAERGAQVQSLLHPGRPRSVAPGAKMSQSRASTEHRRRTSALTSSRQLFRRTLKSPNLAFSTHISSGNGPVCHHGSGDRRARNEDRASRRHRCSGRSPRPLISPSASNHCTLHPAWRMACRVVTLAWAPGRGASVGQLT